MRVWFSGPRIFGARTGLSFGPEDFRRFDRGSGPDPSAGTGPQVGFVYVIEGDHGWVKVGFSTNPLARLATLRTASPFPLKFAYLGALPLPLMPKVEAEAHGYLHKCRVIGEWFGCKPEMAVAALNAAAHRNSVALQPVPEDEVGKVLRTADALSAGAAITGPPEGSGAWPYKAKVALICAVVWGFLLYLLPGANPLALGFGVMLGAAVFNAIGDAVAKL